MAHPVVEIETTSHNEAGSAARFVTWIPWDSGFRGSGLRVGDLIVGHADLRYGPEAVEAQVRIGDSRFSSWLEDASLAPGAPLVVRVLRGDETVELRGHVGEHRGYGSEDGTRLLSGQGPIVYEKDGFDYAWDAWYRQFVDMARTVLAGWDFFASTNSRQLAEQMRAFADRVAFLEQRYPGPLARAVREDFAAMEAMVAGEKRELTQADVAYRTLGETRAADVTVAADKAFSASLAEVEATLLKDPPPAPNPFTEDTRPLVGKWVRLPEVGRRELLNETQRSWYWSGRSGGGYLIDKKAESLTPLYVATDEYIEKVDPYFRDPAIVFVGIVQPEPALVCDALRDITVSGVRVEPVLALVSNASDDRKRFFVDLRPGRMNEAFAGEAALEAGIRRPKLVAEASPDQVLLTAFEALKVGDFETWLSCYAPWKVRTAYERDRSFVYVDLTWETLSRREGTGVWDKARQRLLEDVYGAEVARVGPARVVYDAAAQSDGQEPAEGAPRIVEEVRPVVNHIGKFGDEYRTFAASLLHRRWELQRLDGGPWRITVPYGI
jgi:hypothetical protein